MRTAINTIIAALATTPAFAANGAANEPGILMWAFLGFGAVILVGQAVPAVMLLIGMVKGLVHATKEAKEN